MKSPEEILLQHAPVFQQDFDKTLKYMVIEAMKEYALQFEKELKEVNDLNSSLENLFKSSKEEIFRLQGIIKDLQDDDQKAHHLEMDQNMLLVDELDKLNKLKKWLIWYRYKLKEENVFHKNQGIINAINELLNHDEIF